MDLKEEWTPAANLISNELLLTAAEGAALEKQLVAGVKNDVARFLCQCAGCHLVSRVVHQQLMNKGATQTLDNMEETSGTYVLSLASSVIPGVSRTQRVRELEVCQHARERWSA